jgi:8-oxo-dGTP pyrophosphatase MutT (NUDIX family)
MKTIQIIGKNFCGDAAHTRIACRGIVAEAGKLLLSHERNTGWYLIPGGGLEGSESPEECCARELREETGYEVRPTELFLTLEECYGDWRYITHYFRCTVTGRGKQQLTELEDKRGLSPEWVDTDEALAIFADHMNLTHYEEKRGCYQREHRALEFFLDSCT